MIGLASYLEGLWAVAVSTWASSPTYADRVRTPPAARPHAGRRGTPIDRSCWRRWRAAADAGVTDYASLLPFIAGALGNISDGDLRVALKLLASSGQLRRRRRDESEAKNLIEFGRGLDGAALPAELGGI